MEVKLCKHDWRYRHKNFELNLFNPQTRRCIKCGKVEAFIPTSYDKKRFNFYCIWSSIEIYDELDIIKHADTKLNDNLIICKESYSKDFIERFEHLFDYECFFSCQHIILENVPE